MEFTEDVKGTAAHRNGHIEELAPVHTYIEKDELVEITPSHREYLLQRHGTLELDPIPDMGGADPYNWPAWKVRKFAPSYYPFGTDQPSS